MNAIMKNNGFYYPATFNSFFAKPVFKNHVSTSSTPAVNVLEVEKEFRIELAAPGLTKEDFKLSLNRNRLTISSKIEEAKTTEESAPKYTLKEFSYAAFERTFTIPSSVEIEQISAQYVNGILIVSLPKKEEAKMVPVREIEVA